MLCSDTATLINSSIIFTIIWMSELHAKEWTILNNLLHQHNKWIPWAVIKSCHSAVHEEKRQIQVVRTARKKKGTAKLWQKQVQSQLTQSMTQTRGVKKEKSSGITFRQKELTVRIYLVKTDGTVFTLLITKYMLEKKYPCKTWPSTCFCFYG